MMNTMEEYGAHLRTKVLEVENAQLRTALSNSDAIVIAQLAVHIMVDNRIGSDGAISRHVATARKILAESRRQAAAATEE